MQVTAARRRRNKRVVLNLVMRIAQMVPKDHLPSALNKLLREQGWRRSEYEGRKKK